MRTRLRKRNLMRIELEGARTYGTKCRASCTVADATKSYSEKREDGLLAQRGARSPTVANSFRTTEKLQYSRKSLWESMQHS